MFDSRIDSSVRAAAQPDCVAAAAVAAAAAAAAALTELSILESNSRKQQTRRHSWT